MQACGHASDLHVCRFLYILLTLAEKHLAADIFGALIALKLIRVLLVFKSKYMYISKALTISLHSYCILHT